jgi:hypothetical protein
MRILGGIVGVIVLLVSALFALGISLGAPIGVFVARRMARRKGGQLTRRRSWLPAVIGSSIVATLIMTGFLVGSPATRRLFTQVSTPPSQRQTHLPSWFTRTFPQPDQSHQSARVAIVQSRPFRSYLAILIFEATALMLGAVAGIVLGSVGWVGTVLCEYAWRVGWAASPGGE